MPCWTTTLEIRLEDGSLMKKPVNFRRGLFQGDRLSPLLFALSIAPLSEMLSTRGGVNSAFQRCPVSHLLFMDDLKFYERTRDELAKTMKEVEEVAGAVGMALGIRKCAVAHMKGGAMKRHVGEIRVTGGEVQEVEDGDPYRYLGVHQVMWVHARVTKMRIRTEYLPRVRLVWNSALNAGEKVRAHNTWAVAVLRYYFAVSECHPSDLLELDRATRGTLTQNQAPSLGAAPERLTCR